MPDPLLTLDAPASPADTASGDTAVVTRTDPIALEAAPGQPPAAGPRYVLGEEIARGGMGAVCRATDTVLGREVAVKTLQSRYGPDSSAARRFAGEARITGQLQHPAIPPVHDLGTLPDGRPFLAMKLIRGDTLDESLRERPDITHGRGRFVAAFEQICHAVAYAHACGVIHRDLKPANVMVGAFGEVQVMDWGLAKVVRIADPSAGRDDAEAAGPEIRPLREVDAHFTQAGSVLGTPAYMSPEQAVGAVGKIDARSDVFGLGGILAAILTGRPPFGGGTAELTRQQAALGKVQDCFGRLDGCGADPELVALCKRCLAPEQEDRPADAGEVAKAVAELRAAADERARQADRDRVKAAGEKVAAELKVAEQRRRARLRLALATAVALLAVGGGAFAWWQAEVKAEKAELEAERAAADADIRSKEAAAREQAARLLALATELRLQHRYAESATALGQARDAAAAGAEDLLPAVERARADLAFVRDLDAIRAKRSTWISEPGGKGRFDWAAAPPAYRTAFASRGLDVVADPPRAGAAAAAAAIRGDLVAALDDWFVLEPEPAIRTAVSAALRTADPDSAAAPFRVPAVSSDRAALADLAARLDVARTPPGALIAIAGRMTRRGVDILPLLRRAVLYHPRDFQLAFTLGMAAPRGTADSVPALRAARALRPDHVPTLTLLAIGLIALKDTGEAIAAFEEAIRADALAGGRNAAHLHYNLANALADGGRLDEAIRVCQTAVALDAKDARGHYNLGIFLFRKGAFDEAVRACETAGELDPLNARGVENLGVARHAAGDLDGTIRAWEDVRRLEPKNPVIRIKLSAVYVSRLRHRDAIRVAQEAVGLAPKSADTHAALGDSLRAFRDIVGARAAFGKAAELDPAQYGPLLRRLQAEPAPPPREVE